MKKYLKKSLAVILAFMMVFSYMAYVEPVEADARATINTYRKADKYGTPVWDGSNTYYSKWNSGSSYTTFTWPKHIYMDVSETLESAGYYYTVEWDYGNGTDYRIINNGFIFGGWGLQDTSGWPSNYYTMTNMFNNYDLDASTHGTQYGIDNPTSTDFDLRVGGDNWDGAQVIIWRNPNGDDSAQHQYVFLKGTPKTTGYGLYSTSGSKPNSFGGWQYYSSGWKNASDKYTASNDSGNWTTDCYEGTWKEVRFEITVYDKTDLNNAKQKSDTIYNNNAPYASFITAGLDNYVAQHEATGTMLKTREVTQAGMTTQITNLSSAANALRFAASNSALITAINNANAAMAESDYATKYTQASRTALETALNNAVASTYDEGVTTYAINFSDNTTWNAGSKADADQTAINNYAAAINNALAALKNQYLITFNFANGSSDASYYEEGAAVTAPSNSVKLPDATNHYSYSWSPAVNTTATAAATYNEVLKTEGHSWGEWTQTMAPSCTSEGSKQRSCTSCGYIETASVDKIAHDEKTMEANRVDATCGKDGSYDIVTYCDSCGEILKTENKIIPATGNHNYITEIERVPAKCTEDGYYVMQCKCGDTKTTTLTAPGHSPAGAVIENRTESSCTVPGSYDEVVYCTVCTAELSRVTQALPLAEHVPATAVTENYNDSTCTEKGSYDEVVYCQNCPKELSRVTKEIEMKDHTPKASVEENRTESTCVAQGSYDSVIYCKDCNFEIARTSVILPLSDHKEADAVKENVTEATCTSVGYYESVVYCEVCNDELSRTPVDVPMADHDYVDHEAQPPTCKDGGWFAYQTCKNCSYSTYKYIEATGEHVYATEQERVPATCTEDGYVIMACGCGTTQKTTLAASGHSPKEAVKENDIPATCTVDGSYDEVVYCDVCNAELSREGKVNTAPGHSPKDAVKENDIPASCTVNGSYDEVVYCGICNEELSREGKVNTAPGHSPKAAVKENEVEGDCLTEGSYDEVVYCDVCNEEISRTPITTPVTGHKALPAVKENIVDSTCSEAGSYDEVVYCEVCDEEISRNTVEIPVKKHTAGSTVIENKVDATCVIPASYDEVKYCKDCGTEVSRKTVIGSTVNHKYSKAVKENINAATCTQPGTYDQVIYCSVCNGEMGRVTVDEGAKGHTIVADPAVKPTCDKAGKTLGSHCSVCSTVIVAQKEVPAPGHTVVDDFGYEPTCTRTGLTDGSHCQVCKTVIVKQEVIPALGHIDEDEDGICDLDGRDVTDMDPDYDDGLGFGPDYEGDGSVSENVCPDCGREHINFFSGIICFVIRLLRMLGFDVK